MWQNGELEVIPEQSTVRTRQSARVINGHPSSHRLFALLLYRYEYNISPAQG